MAILTSFVHIRDEKNTGDMASCPADYFDIPGRIYNYSDDLPDGVTIFGGGTMVNWLHQKPKLPNGPKILWGAGSSRHGETEPWPDPEGFELIGTREWTPEREKAGKWAPCVSCMSPLFDREYEITRERVAFVNASVGIRLRYPAVYDLDVPLMANDQPMADVIQFLGSAETVVTNSYHGCWFGLLLGKRIVCYPYSSKFFNFKYPIEYASGNDVWEKEKRASIYPEALAESRESTIIFSQKVRSIIGDSRY